MPVYPIIKTAPTEAAYAEINLADKSEVFLLNPVDNDVLSASWRTHRTRTLKSMQRRIGFRCLGLTLADTEQLQKWYNNRVRLRPFGNYGQHTKFYQAFQRATDDGQVGAQIGTVGTFAHDFVTSPTNRYLTYLSPSGVLVTVPEDTPRYEPAAFGMNGILIESRRYNYFWRSHPQTGDSLWSISSGTPIITLIDEQSIVDIEAKLTRLQFASTERVEAETPSSGPLYTASSGSYTGSIWVKGMGTIKLHMLQNGTPVNDSGNVVLTGAWQRIETPRHIKTAGSVPLGLEIEAMSAGIVFVGPIQIEDTHHVQSYIHNVTGTDEDEIDAVTQEITATVPDIAVTVYVGLVMPPLHVDDDDETQWVFRRWTSSAYFGMLIKSNDQSGAISNVAFFKRNASDSVGYVSTLSGGEDVVLAGSYGAAGLTIYENGVLKNTEAWTADPTQLGHTSFFLGDTESSNAGVKTPLAFLRLDDITHTDAEVLANSRLYTDPDNAFWTTRCEGRNFEIESFEPRTVEGNPDQFRGDLILREVFSYASATVETP